MRSMFAFLVALLLVLSTPALVLARGRSSSRAWEGFAAVLPSQRVATRNGRARGTSDPVCCAPTASQPTLVTA
jgi:hypothetical protein